ncbi:MAG TPA: ribose 5-phosphate isomerase B [Syntrophales bacterium]
MRIIIGSDHAGFALKETVKSYLSSAGYRVFDAGTHREESVDYPDYGVQAAERVSSGEFEKGILICGSGVGMAIVANKFPGIRAAVCLDEETAKLSRQHNDSNILVLAGRKTEPAAAERIIKAWLETPFEGGRHQKRLDKIRQIEQRLCK